MKYGYIDVLTWFITSVVCVWLFGSDYVVHRTEVVFYVVYCC
jgi:hypothetical protein